MELLALLFILGAIALFVRSEGVTFDAQAVKACEHCGRKSPGASLHVMSCNRPML